MFKNNNSASKRITYNHGGIQLTYRDGEVCNEKNKETYATLIQFICDPKQSDPVASLIAQSQAGCNHHIAVRTKMACEIKSECAASNPEGDYLDLSELVPVHGHEIVRDGPSANKRQNIFWLNVP